MTQANAIHKLFCNYPHIHAEPQYYKNWWMKLISYHALYTVTSHLNIKKPLQGTNEESVHLLRTTHPTHSRHIDKLQFPCLRERYSFCKLSKNIVHVIRSILPYKHRHSILLRVLKIVDCEKRTDRKGKVLGTEMQM
jgi:hypothetical protein